METAHNSFADPVRPASWFVAIGICLRWLGIYILAFDILYTFADFVPEYYNEWSMDVLPGLLIAMLLTVSELLFTRFRKISAASIGKRHHLNQAILRSILVMVFISYGTGKIIDRQFGNEYAVLDTPLYTVDGFQLAWRFFDYSYSYKFFIGLSQLVGALLLVYRRTTTLACLILLPVITNIVFVNFTHTKVVTFTSSLYLVMTAYLLICDYDRLYALLITNTGVGANRNLDTPTYRFFKTKLLKGIVAAYLLLAAGSTVYEYLEVSPDRNISSIFKGGFRVNRTDGSIPSAQNNERVYIEEWYGRAMIRDGKEDIPVSITVDEQQKTLVIKYEDSTVHKSIYGTYTLMPDKSIAINGKSGEDSIKMKWERFID